MYGNKNLIGQTGNIPNKNSRDQRNNWHNVNAPTTIVRLWPSIDYAKHKVS